MMSGDDMPVPGENHTPPIPIEQAKGGITRAVCEHGHLAGFTFNPKTGLAKDVTKQDQCRDLYRDLIGGSRNFVMDDLIYLVAVTCHIGTEIDDILRNGYARASRITNQPLIGYWKNSEGVPYLDAVIPAQFISDRQAIEAGKRYEQEFILEIGPDGIHDHIKAD